MAQRNTKDPVDNNLFALVRGFTPKIMIPIPGKNLKGLNKITSIFKNIINKIQEGFHKQIWIPRCNRWQLWQEKENRNLKKEIKSQIKSYNQDTDSNYESDLPKRNGSITVLIGKNTLGKGEKKERALDIYNITIRGKIERG